jgi:4-oxalomesaconate tautomerase
VPGTAAPIAVAFMNTEGPVCARALLPTGHAVDRVAGVDCTLIDNGMPVVVLAATAVGRTGLEPRDLLDKDQDLKARLEAIRLEAGRLMGLGDVSKKVVPKMCLVAPPAAGGTLATRSFIPHECRLDRRLRRRRVATAAMLPGQPGRRGRASPGRRRQDALDRASDRRIQRRPDGRRQPGGRSSSAPACCAPRACSSTASPSRMRTRRAAAALARDAA